MLKPVEIVIPFTDDSFPICTYRLMGLNVPSKKILSTKPNTYLINSSKLFF